MATTRTVLDSVPVPEASTPVLRFTFVDEAGATVSTLATATVLLYDEASGSVINARDRTSLLVGGLNVVTAGVLRWRLAAADTAIVNVSTGKQHTIALIEWTWDDSGVTAAGKHEIELHVVNLAKVPA